MKIELLTDHQTNVIKPIEIASLQFLPLNGYIDDCSYVDHKGKLCYANGIKDLHNKLISEAYKYLEETTN